jgi:uncharacterized protein YndB with AHSA1/START domain
MTRPLTVSDHVVVAAAPERLYALLSDPARMSRWSPENTGATVDGGAAATVGTRFLGTNRRGPLRWTTECEVTAAEPGERFAFRVLAWGVRRPVLRVPVATWEYRLAPVDGGTRVTETWTDDRTWPAAVAAVFDRLATGGHTFAEFQRRNIRATLGRLKADVEA